MNKLHKGSGDSGLILGFQSHEAGSLSVEVDHCGNLTG